MNWYDLDYPEVIELRRRLFPEHSGYHLIASSVTDAGWIGKVPSDHPAWIVAEGLTYYLSEADMKGLLNLLTGHFPSGQIAFDAVSHQGARLAARNARIRTTGATIGWSIDDPHDIKRLDPRLELVTELRPVQAHSNDRLPASFRVLLSIMDLLPSLRRINRLLRYRF